jgi:hypothetical protein
MLWLVPLTDHQGRTSYRTESTATILHFCTSPLQITPRLRYDLHRTAFTISESDAKQRSMPISGPLVTVRQTSPKVVFAVVPPINCKHQYPDIPPIIPGSQTLPCRPRLLAPAPLSFHSFSNPRYFQARQINYFPACLGKSPPLYYPRTYPYCGSIRYLSRLRKPSALLHTRCRVLSTASSVHLLPVPHGYSLSDRPGCVSPAKPRLRASRDAMAPREYAAYSG